MSPCSSPRQPARSATVTWDDGSADGKWSTPANWSGDNVPSSGDHVRFTGLSGTDCDADVVNNSQGYGGGAIKIVVDDTITVNGAISADGGDGMNGEAGGGSGGAIWIQANTWTGGTGGVIRVNGGSTTGGSAGGGGGRIRIEYTVKTFTGSATAEGGTGNETGATGQVVEIDTTVPNSKPDAPALSYPTNGTVLNITFPYLRFSATDAYSDYLRYKIEIATDTDFTNIVQVINQPSSQTGWFGQTEQSATAYASGEPATFLIQTGLTANTVHYWRTYAIDPDGSNAWSDASTNYSFTTGPIAQ